jgi:hypothetical protein
MRKPCSIPKCCKTIFKLLSLGVAMAAAFLAMSLSASAAPAREEWESLASKGDVKSMISLGLLYHTGDGVPIDYAKAMDWYLKAYEKTDGDALNNIGVMFRDGLGVKQDRKVAYVLFLMVHMEGLGTEATQYRAGRNLGRLAESMKKEEIQEALSYTWDYVNQIVRSRGKNMEIGKDVLPAKDRPRIRDNNWWLDSERKTMDFNSPPPWDKVMEGLPAKEAPPSPSPKSPKRAE